MGSICVFIKGSKLDHGSNLRKDCGILQFVILTEEYDLGNDFCCLGILIHKGQENSATVLGMDRQDAEHGAADLMDHAAAQMDGIASQLLLC